MLTCTNQNYFHFNDTLGPWVSSLSIYDKWNKTKMTFTYTYNNSYKQRLYRVAHMIRIMLKLFKITIKKCNQNVQKVPKKLCAYGENFNITLGSIQDPRGAE